MNIQLNGATARRRWRSNRAMDPTFFKRITSLKSKKKKAQNDEFEDELRTIDMAIASHFSTNEKKEDIVLMQPHIVLMQPPPTVEIHETRGDESREDISCGQRYEVRLREDDSCRQRYKIRLVDVDERRESSSHDLADNFLTEGGMERVKETVFGLVEMMNDLLFKTKGDVADVDKKGEEEKGAIEALENRCLCSENTTDPTLYEVTADHSDTIKEKED